MYRLFIRLLGVLGIVLAGWLFIWPSQPVQAGGVVGTGTPASCTEAALDTALIGGGTVTFNCGAAPHTIILTFYKQIGDNTELQGGGLITLSGNNSASLFQVFSGKTLSLRDITLRQGNGSLTSGFGAIQNFGTLNLTNSQLISNTSPASGGAIENSGVLTLTNSVIAGNTASSGGGGIYNDGGSVTIQGSTVYSNTAGSDGGGIYSQGSSSVTIQGSNIYSNTATGSSGGGIYNTSSSSFILSHSTLRGNTANTDGGGLFNSSETPILTNVTISGNTADEGGGISHSASTSSAQLRLTNVTISNNTTDSYGGGLYYVASGVGNLLNVTFSGNTTTGASGGGLYNYAGAMNLTNVTFSSNSAAAYGGGLFNLDAVALSHVTFSGNSAGLSGGGIYRFAGTVSARASIVANSPAGGNCGGPIGINQGFNLATDATCSGFNQVVNVMLGPLANNGGFTQTHLPQPGSPAIDLVAAGCPPPATDQRGANRPVDGDNNGIAWCDAGAVEYGAITSAVYLPLVIK